MLRRVKSLGVYMVGFMKGVGVETGCSLAIARELKVQDCHIPTNE